MDAPVDRVWTSCPLHAPLGRLRRSAQIMVILNFHPRRGRHATKKTIRHPRANVPTSDTTPVRCSSGCRELRRMVRCRQNGTFDLARAFEITKTPRARHATKKNNTDIYSSFQGKCFRELHCMVILGQTSISNQNNNPNNMGCSAMLGLHREGSTSAECEPAVAPCDGPCYV